MAKYRPKPNPAWSRREHRPARPWTETEDAEVAAIARCGVASDFWSTFLPDRTFGEIAERREQLRKAGRAGYPTPL